MEKRHAVLP